MTSTISSLEKENLKLREENIMLKKLLDLSEKNLLQIAYMASSSSRNNESNRFSTAYSRNIKNDSFLIGLRQQELKNESPANLEAITFVVKDVLSETPVEKLGQIQTRSSRKRPYS
jgi:hypothetical protein